MCIHFQAVCNLIESAVTVGEVETFLWNHISADLSIIGRALGKSKDDVLLLLHSILYHMVSRTANGE